MIWKCCQEDVWKCRLSGIEFQRAKKLLELRHGREGCCSAVREQIMFHQVESCSSASLKTKNMQNSMSKPDHMGTNL